MEILHNWRNLAPEARGAVIAWGNFDGVHLGHQQVIAEAAEAAFRLGAPLGVGTLEPHPITVFNPGGPPFHLTKLDQMARVLASLAVERLYLVPFGHQMAELSDRAFVPLNRVSVNTSITKVIVGSRGKTLVSYNDHSHLEDAGVDDLVTYR